MFTARQVVDTASSGSQQARVSKDQHSDNSSVQRVFRSTSAWVYSGFVWAFCGLCAVLAVLQEPIGLAARILLVLVTVSLLSWIVLVRPHLIVTRDAVVISNVLRTHVIPLSAVRYVRTRGLVEVIASHDGDERTFRSWNAPGNRAWKPTRGEAHAAGFPGAPRSHERSKAGTLAPGGAIAQRLIEEQMDRLGDTATDGHVRSRWNANILLSAFGLILISIGAWWL